MKYEQQIDDFLFERSYTGWRLKNGSPSFFSSRTKIFKATLLKREKISNTKILIKSTDFDVNIF